MATGRDGGLFCLSYVVDDSHTAICQARICPPVRCQPKDGVLDDDSFYREASSLIGRLTFGRCGVALDYNTDTRLPVGLHLIDVMLDHVFIPSHMQGWHCPGRLSSLLREAGCGVYPYSSSSLLLEVSTLPAPPVFFRKHTFTQARQLGHEVCLGFSLLSHKFGEGYSLVKKLV